MQNSGVELAKHRQDINGILATLQGRLLEAPGNGARQDCPPYSSFDRWLAETGRRAGFHAYLSEQQYRGYYRQGRINDGDIGVALACHGSLDAGKTFAGTTLEAIYRALLIYGLPLTARQRLPLEAMRREVTAFSQEGGIEADTDRQLWQSITEKLALAPPPPLEEPAKPVAAALDTAPPDPHASTRLQAGLEFDLLMSELGRSISLRDFVQALSGIDVLTYVRPALLRVINSALDQGVACWRLTETGQGGLYEAWRASLPFDAQLFLHQLPDWQEMVTGLPEQAVDCISLQLLKLALPPSRWETYLQRLLNELPGCSQLIAGNAGQAKSSSVSLADVLAIRLVLDRLWLNQACQDLWQVEAKTSALATYFQKNLSEFMVRKYLFQGQLPEHLAALAETLIIRAGSERQCRGDWQRLADLLYAWWFGEGAKPGQHPVSEPGGRLFHLCRHLGFDSRQIEPLEANDLVALLQLADGFDANAQGKIWLHALEHQYRHQLLCALQANLQKTKKQPLPSRPVAQVIFCMDNREESTRSNLEQLEPTLETFGSRGFFFEKNSFFNDDGQPPIKPKSFVQQQLQMGLAQSFITINCFAPIALLHLVGKAVWPNTRQRLPAIRPIKDKMVSPAIEPAPVWDADTQARLAADFLLDIGLTGEFSDWVVLLGHSPTNGQGGRHTQPFCRACQGRHDTLKAEMMAAILNQPSLRPLLKGYGIDIPGQTRFIAAGRDKNGQLGWPASCRLPGPPALDQLKSLLQHALTVPAEATGHPAACSNHSGHAALIVGRRQITRGLPLERRAFLLSYDPVRDFNGERLEKILAAELPGLIDMNLDYYSASVKIGQNADISNIHDNPVGYFSVMSGTEGDYRTGFSRQELETHEAMRLTLVVESEKAVLEEMLRRNAVLNNIFAGGWAYLAVIDHKVGLIFAHEPGAGLKLLDSVVTS